jgi:hypothetical protein
MSGAEEGMRAASSVDQEPERNLRVIWFWARALRKEDRISGVSSMSPVWEASVGEISGGEVVVTQIRRRLGRVARRRTEEL